MLSVFTFMFYYILILLLLSYKRKRWKIERRIQVRELRIVRLLAVSSTRLLAVLKLHQQLLKKPEPIPKDSTDFRWKHLKNCLGALDGTHVKVTVPTRLKGRYRSRMGYIVTNVLGVCASDMQFIYVLLGWEGFAHDDRVLRDALSRKDGLCVPNVCYYLVEIGYTNANGFLAPFQGQRARNIIERAFGSLKGCWVILWSPSYFLVKTQCRIIIACALLHNLIFQNMSQNLFECDEQLMEASFEDLEGEISESEFITAISTSNEWTGFRNNLAQETYNIHLASTPN
ncbi:hypothetical protein U9M48_039182 [Paspalum notatum var. saurae]|uniref:DDE Tnp4 domain-containing protein n=1 Tax=Paspalum notatum var. saurae TaxID=547442 RepID=A0AAQ3UJ61_PASNO